MTKEAAQKRLEELRGSAKFRSSTVRTLARFATNSQCRLATLGFAARVDFDYLLSGTKFQVPFGQSPFAFRRGTRFEELLRADGHTPILRLLNEKLRFPVEGARVVNLRDCGSMSERARLTETLIREIAERKPGAPNLLDGAVLAREVGGILSHFEADAVAAQFNSPVHTGEIKSFPTVDGQADPENVGAALAQASIYILLLRELTERLGGDPNTVSAEALLITPRNTGLQPTLTVKNVSREIQRAERILNTAPRAEELVPYLPSDIPTFGEVANESRPESERIEAGEKIAEAIGTRYRPECLASCGMSRLCRERAEKCGDPARNGASVLRLLPQVSSIDRAYELADGAIPSPAEKPVAEQLLRAASYLNEARATA